MRNALVFAALLLSPVLAQAAPITGWLVHNGTSTGGGTTSNPTFTSPPSADTTSDTVSLLAPFSDVTLTNDGDYVEVQSTLTLTGRSISGVNSLNANLRFGLFDDSVNSTLAAGDSPNVGFSITYSNTTTAGAKEQTSTLQVDPFASLSNVSGATVTQDTNGGSLQGKNPGAATFDIKITRDGGKLDLSGTISGTDSVTTKAYTETFSATGYSSTNFPANGDFTFNRIGFFLGDGATVSSGVQGGNAALSSSAVLTNTPEPASFALLAGLGGLLATSRRRRQSAR